MARSRNRPNNGESYDSVAQNRVQMHRVNWIMRPLGESQTDNKSIQPLNYPSSTHNHPLTPWRILQREEEEINQPDTSKPPSLPRSLHQLTFTPQSYPSRTQPLSLSTPISRPQPSPDDHEFPPHIHTATSTKTKTRTVLHCTTLRHIISCHAVQCSAVLLCAVQITFHPRRISTHGWMHSSRRQMLASPAPSACARSEMRRGRVCTRRHRSAAYPDLKARQGRREGKEGRQAAERVVASRLGRYGRV